MQLSKNFKKAVVSLLKIFVMQQIFIRNFEKIIKKDGFSVRFLTRTIRNWKNEKDKNQKISFLARR